MRRQSWSPFAQEPVEFTALNFDFHPQWMREQLISAEFSPQSMLTVSHFRIGALKRWVPTRLLVGIDRNIQFTGRWWQLAPSVFVASQSPLSGVTAPTDSFFACPECVAPLGDPVDNVLACTSCTARWGIENGIYNFKTPLP
jgi:hypothetical protein